MTLLKPPGTISHCHHIIVFNLAEATKRRDETPDKAYREELDGAINIAKSINAPYVVLVFDERKARYTVPARSVFAQIWEGSLSKEFERGEVYALLRIPEKPGISHVRCELDKDYNLTCKRTII
jgi:hypothetical protein